MDIHNFDIPIVEIFESIQGEGLRTGYITTFIRTFGCNLKCMWCDTKYSRDNEKFKNIYSIADIITDIRKYNNACICITGGEPLLQRNIYPLIQKMYDEQICSEIIVETNGSIDISDLIKMRKNNQASIIKLRIAIDFKLNSSKESHRMILSNYEKLNHEDELKFIISNTNDFKEAIEFLKTYKSRANILFSPNIKKMSSKKLVKLMLLNKVQNSKINLQIHKVIWGNRKGV